MYGSLYMVHGTWFNVHGSLYMGQGTWFILHVSLYLVHCTWFIVHGSFFIFSLIFKFSSNNTDPMDYFLKFTPRQNFALRHRGSSGGG